MCGISGIVGSSDITKRLYNCMLNLEYRGYDSCGMAVISDGKLDVRKNTGRVAEVFEKERFQQLRGATGIAHSRWATHGKPSKVNSHPHVSPNGRIAVVHNGIVGNYQELKEELISKGHVFKSDTDSEVIPQLLQFYYEEEGNFERAMSATMGRLEGTFAFVAIEAGHPGLLFCARNRNPLIIGVGRDANYVASDIVAFIEYTKNVVYLNDNEYAIIAKDRFEVKNASTGEFVHKKINTVAWDAEQARKGGYPHFLLKEIYEQPVALREALSTDERDIEAVAEMMNGASRTYLIGCGTTFYASLLAQYYFKEFAGVFVPAVSSDEFKSLCDVDEGTLVIAVSQSGETFDTLEALRYARAKGARTAAIVNALGSSMTRDVDLVIMQGAGPEKSVLSTKAMTSQIAILTRIVLSLARMRSSLPGSEIDEIRAGLDDVVVAVRTVLDEKPGFIRKIANRVGGYKKWLYIGRGYHLPAAL
nr:glutamine--fructose-6-phosphate transaminase (isomerizing) [Bacillota bacterium]